jgi:CubicO group peptidase (beta-lactamase class C family)
MGTLPALATRTAATLLPALLLAAPLAASTAAPQATLATPRQLPPDSVVLRLIRERVESGRNPGIVVGLLDEGGTRVVAYGSSGVKGLPLDGRTIFEIGSITKTFTTSLLADMVARGEVRLDEPVEELLPDSVRVPSYRGRRITLLDLATHTSGLPRNPDNLHPSDPEDPWADYTVSDLYQFLGSYELTRAPGAEVEYSNVGLGLLGYALTLRGGKSYEALLRERILDPLGMNATRVTLSPARARRLARGYDESGKAVEHWHIPALPGMGALRSDVDDLFRYLAAHHGLSGGDLIPVLASTHKTYASLDDTAAVALGWLVDRSGPARPFWWHDGETGGFHSFAAFEPAGRRAVVILSNGANSIDDVGFRILSPIGASASGTPGSAATNRRRPCLRCGPSRSRR